MAYDEQLTDRVRKLLKRRKGFSERKMFGGMCFMLHGNMCCGVTHSNLMLRLGAERAPHARDGFHGPPHEGHGLCRTGRLRRRRGPQELGHPSRRVRFVVAPKEVASGRPFFAQR